MDRNNLEKYIAYFVMAVAGLQLPYMMYEILNDSIEFLGLFIWYLSFVALFQTGIIILERANRKKLEEMVNDER